MGTVYYSFSLTRSRINIVWASEKLKWYGGGLDGHQKQSRLLVSGHSSEVGLTVGMKEAADANRHTDPQLFGNLQGLSIQSHYQLRKPLVYTYLLLCRWYALLPTSLAAPSITGNIPAFSPPAAPCLEGFFIHHCISKYLLFFFKMCKKKQVCLFYHNHSKVRVQLSWKNFSLTWNVRCRCFLPWLKISAFGPESWSRWWRWLCWPGKKNIIIS